MDDFNILAESFNKIRTYIRENQTSEKPVVNHKTPKELASIVNVQIPEQGVSENDFLKLVDSYLEFAVRTGHKQFVNQLFAGFNMPAFIGDIISILTNTSMYTYEVAPYGTLIENEMINMMKSYVGYDIATSDGIFLSGGSNSNLIAMFSARNKFDPDSRFKGYNKALKLTAFVNKQAHYSLDTAANLIGIGSANVVHIECDDMGRMIPEELEKAIIKCREEGGTPFFVAATCGTTMLAAFDPVDEIHKITEKHGLWLHADGSFGGSLLISEKHRSILNGVAKADSFCWNPHKLMNIPLTCSALLVKKRGTLHSNLTDINTDYLYHNTDDIEDLGLKSIQCGRRVDAVKLWFAWKYYGKEGYESRVNNQIAMAELIEQTVKDTPKLELLANRSSVAVCFRYIPEKETNINEFNKKIRDNLRVKGKTIVNYGYIFDNILAIRFNSSNAELDNSDVAKFFDNFMEEAQLLEKEL